MEPSFSKIGDVRPQNVFINDKGHIKVSNLNSWPREISNFSKSFENEVTYLGTSFIIKLPSRCTNWKPEEQKENKTIIVKTSPLV